MKKEYNFSHLSEVDIKHNFLLDWQDSKNKVFVFKNNGIEVDSSNALSNFYESFFSKIGRFLNLAEDALLTNCREHQRTGQVWMEIRNDDSVKNAYRHSTNAQPLHTDGSYIPGFAQSILACLSNVGVGGETIFIDPSDLIKDLEVGNPEFLSALFEHDVLHERSGDARTEKILYWVDNILKINFNFYCVSPKNSKEVIELSNKFLNYLIAIEKKENPNVLPMPVKLSPGDAVIWKDDEVLHGRHAFTATKNSERNILKCAFKLHD